ncbi:unnamed protein product (macronuclear) [Paramecium tetraurelia]|uniref:Chromosome undetermined scaffold_112, whole genome shotgun sequence n=1 Tax=Paramecium tetraurelia TaxID=5888 RepID=A0BKN0_PARTE|nr:uncharacterized protein GSPATT00029728001 [Paramecium tetraurelia]XP_001441652.1 uncharacterized protein GSPATT00038988001 [Paramecium tetraurelia]CAK59097.1 unnamed protein product [Paramecium tetraurelia]CAK74255.1 unnamed protein product [Paramecium tetraurelia]|eukprot:XP_001426495.1 hypothetical protein (macronuclear) [Paramecium tetraurelia strain d4-2]
MMKLRIKINNSEIQVDFVYILSKKVMKFVKIMRSIQDEIIQFDFKQTLLIYNTHRLLFLKREETNQDISHGSKDIFGITNIHNCYTKILNNCTDVVKSKWIFKYKYK